jgi:hypothetical protein
MADSLARWDPADLIRRVLQGLDLAREMIRGFDNEKPTVTHSKSETVRGNWFLRQKVIAETAMLLFCIDPIAGLDERIRERHLSVARILIPHARHRDVLGAICLDPGIAGDYAVAHVLLSSIGYPDTDIDNLLRESLAIAPGFGPERLPHRQLEREWLSRISSFSWPGSGRERELLSNSMLGKFMDALGSSRLDVYAFTHAAMYATGFGRRRPRLPRSRASIVADADAALAFSLDSNDFDLTAEVTLTWPLLGLGWSPTAIFAFGLLAEMQDDLGFLPGSAFNRRQYEALQGSERSQFSLDTSYHAEYVMGFLCAIALGCRCMPAPSVPMTRRSCGSGEAMLRILDTHAASPHWLERVGSLPPRQQDAIGSFLLTVLLRRAKATGDLALIRTGLEAANRYDLIHGPAVAQAAALLRRCDALKRCFIGAHPASESSGKAGSPDTAAASSMSTDSVKLPSSSNQVGTPAGSRDLRTSGMHGAATTWMG